MKNKEEENYNFEIEFFEKVLKERQDFVHAMMALGDLYTKKGWYEKGLEMDRRLSRLRPEDPLVFYNLACSYSLLKRIDHALGAMKLAIQNGYDHFEYLQRDPDLENLRQSDQFRNFLSALKKK